MDPIFERKSPPTQRPIRESSYKILFFSEISSILLPHIKKSCIKKSFAFGGNRMTSISVLLIHFVLTSFTADNWKNLKIKIAEWKSVVKPCHIHHLLSCFRILYYSSALCSVNSSWCGPNEKYWLKLHHTCAAQVMNKWWSRDLENENV